MVFIGKYLFRYRGVLPLPWIAIGWFFMEADWVFLSLGILVGLIGLLLRGVAISSIGVKARTVDQTVGNLTQNGLYRWCRNPLYVSNIIIWSGVFCAFANWPLWCLAIAYFVLQYWCIVLWEESILLAEKQQFYIQYMNRTPRWFSFALPEQVWGSISFLKVLRYERSTLISFIIVYATIFSGFFR